MELRSLSPVFDGQAASSMKATGLCMQSKSRRGVLSVATALVVALTACFVERPVANEHTARSRAAGLFALDCRAWPQGPLAIDMRASLVDFGEGDPELSIVWIVDGVSAQVEKGPKPTGTGTPVQYRREFSRTHAFDRAGAHTLGASVTNGLRTASCSASVDVGSEAQRAQ
jgi:hypothetical protein